MQGLKGSGLFEVFISVSIRWTTEQGFGTLSYTVVTEFIFPYRTFPSDTVIYSLQATSLDKKH